MQDWEDVQWEVDIMQKMSGDSSAPAVRGVYEDMYDVHLVSAMSHQQAELVYSQLFGCCFWQAWRPIMSRLEAWHTQRCRNTVTTKSLLLCLSSLTLPGRLMPALDCLP